jgi:ACS family sodium-dependent inorganic phosphate cotransporter-like MFS transporter 5
MTAKTEKDPELTELGRQVPCWLSWRIYLAVIAFFGFINIYAQRVCMSVAIVCMVNQTAVKMLALEEEGVAQSMMLGNMTNMTYDVTTISSLNATSGPGVVAGPQCERASSSGDSSGEGEFVWSKGIQGQVLGSFFYGYIVSQIPGGLLAERFGAKRVMLIFMFVATIGTVLSPIAAQVNYIFLIVVRVIVGLASGVVYPATHALWSQCPHHWRGPSLLDLLMLVDGLEWLLAFQSQGYCANMDLLGDGHQCSM